MRELAVAALLLGVLVIAAAVPKLWPSDADGGALASARSPAAIASGTVAPVSWKGRDGGTGFVVCGSNESWMRPTIDEENAHLAADPRYAGIRADDSYSRAWLPFRAGASLFDGSSADERDDLVALTGLWNDPHFAANAGACASIEPQIWLFGYAPAKYTAEDRFIATLQVAPAPGYRMVVLTGVIRPQLVVAGSMKVAFFAMPTSAVTPTLTPAAKPTQPTTPNPAFVFPSTDRPLQLALPTECRLLEMRRHTDEQGAFWLVQCGSAKANLSVAVTAMRQGWAHLSGPPLGVGLQNYAKGTLTMTLAYRLDGPAYADDFSLVQYSRPYSAGGPAPASPFAYLREPTGFDLPTGCGWRESPAGFTSDGAYKLAFSCPDLRPAEIQPTFNRTLQAQGWHVDNGGFGFLTYAKDDLRLTATFADEKAEPSQTPWVVEAFCCFGA